MMATMSAVRIGGGSASLRARAVIAAAVGRAHRRALGWTASAVDRPCAAHPAAARPSVSRGLPSPSVRIYSSITSLSAAAPTSSATATASATASRRPISVVLGVETSCDDTAMALLDAEGRVLSHACASQWELFDVFHGVQPLQAASAHAGQMDAVFRQVLAKAALTEEDVSAVACTAGPGMAPCLKVGLTWASGLARRRSLPYVGVHHMQAHALVAGLTHPQLQYPFLSLLISGGHTELWLVEGISRVTILSETVDDAIGEAFDKAARLIGVKRDQGSPGAAVEKLARQAVKVVHHFPELAPSHMDFSFSGLKSALQRKVFNMRLKLAQDQQAAAAATSTNETNVAAPSLPSSSDASSPPSPQQLPVKLRNRDISQLVREFKHDLFRDTPGETHHAGPPSASALSLPPLPLQDQIDLCAAFQSALIGQLTSRTLLAVRHCRSRYPHLRLSQLVVAGGVACNSAVRSALVAAVEPYHLEVLAPPPLHCTDNGIMIAHLGRQLLLAGHTDPYELCFYTRWPIGDKEAMQRVKDDRRRGRDLRAVDQQANAAPIAPTPAPVASSKA